MAPWPTNPEVSFASFRSSLVVDWLPVSVPVLVLIAALSIYSSSSCSYSLVPTLVMG